MRKATIVKTLLCLCMFLIPIGTSAQGNKVSINVKDVSLPSALRQVEQQSGYYKINYPSSEVSRYKVTANVKNATAPNAVDELLKGLPFTSSVNGQFIQIKRTSQAATQTRNNQVRGRILDADGEPLIGVAVQVEGTNKGTVTDYDGNYVLEDVTENDVLTFSYVGKQTLKRKASYKPVLIILEDDTNLIDDVVVTGYQTLKKESATGSFQKITSDDMEKRYTTTLLENLEGQVPGLMSYSTGLNGEGESTLSIRGIATFQASTKPLIVVDGLPIEGDLETLNPYDIASITVLKDAAAASIYGARASNGVVVVVTKRGTKKDKIEISMNASLTIAEKQTYDNYGYASVADGIDTEIKMMDEIFNDPMGAMYEGFYWPTYASYYSPSARLYMQHRNGEISDTEYQSALNKYRNSNYMEEYRDLALRDKVTQQYNLALRSKTERGNQNVTFDFLTDNQGFTKEHNRSYNFGYNGDLNIKKWLTASFGINVRYNNRKNHYEPTNITFLSSPYSFPAYASMYNADGSLAYNEAGIALDDPVFSNESLGLKYLGYNLQEQLNYNFSKREQTNIRSYAHLKFNITDWLKLSSMFQFEKIKSTTENYIEKDSYAQNFIYDLYTSGGTHYLPDAGILDTNHSNGNYYTFRNQADFNKTFAGKHEVSAIAGIEIRQTKTRVLNSKLLGYDDNTQTNYMNTLNIYQLSRLGSSDLFASRGTIAPSYYYSIQYKGGYYDGAAYGTSDVRHRYTSVYLTANYTYDHRYSLSGSYRVDKTDLFGADPKYRGRPLWSIGASWNIQNEAFMKDVKWVNMLKMRLSYGLTGNIDPSVSSYLVGRIYTSQTTLNKYAGLSTPPNDQLRWEKTTSWNLGIDYSVLNNRIMGSLDFYRKFSTDILSNTALDPSEGFTSLVINNGEASNKGVELQVNAAILKPRTHNALGFNLAFNIAHNSNKVEKVTYTPQVMTLLGWGQSSHALVEGNAINSLYAIGYAGHDVNGYTQWYKADGTTSIERIYGGIKTEDVMCMGTLDPKLTMSLTPTITFGDFSLSAMFSYYGGHVMRARTSDWIVSSSLTGLGRVPQKLCDYFNDPDNYELPLPTIGNYLNQQNSGQSLYFFDKAVVPADYMKLRNIVLGYTVPKLFCKKIGIESARLRVQVNNVAKWVKNDLGVDPEANNPWTGFDINTPMRSYTMNLSINF